MSAARRFAPGSRGRFTFVTGNRSKLAEARRIVGPEVEAVALDLPEIQSLDLDEILAAKAEEAWRRLGRPLVVEDTGLGLAALGGFPGPLVKWMLDAAGPEGLARTASALGDPRATITTALVYRDGERTVGGRGEVDGRLVLPPRGDSGFGWDPVFVQEGQERTYAELGDEVKDRIGPRGRAWRDLVGRLGPHAGPDGSGS